MSVKKFDERPDGFNEYLNHQGKLVRIDPKKAHNLLCFVESAKKTMGDVVLIYTGEEGSGKSTQARQDAKLIDPTIDESRIEFNPEDAIKAHFRGLPEVWDPAAYMRGEYPSKPWEVIILDESAKLDRKRTMSAGSVEFTAFLSQSRQLHKIFIIVLPNAHMLDGYVAEHRALACIHSYKYENQHMGFFNWYGRKGLRQMFTSEMHKRKLYPRKYNFDGRFSGVDPFDLTKYEKKKAAALNAFRKMEEGKATGETKEELLLAIHFQALKNAVEKKLVEKPIYEALEIPRRTWEDRKRKAISDGLINYEPKNGVGKHLRQALEKTQRFMQVETDDEYSI